MASYGTSLVGARVEVAVVAHARALLLVSTIGALGLLSTLGLSSSLACYRGAWERDGPPVAMVEHSLGENSAQLLRRAGNSGKTYAIYLLGGIVEVYIHRVCCWGQL